MRPGRSARNRRSGSASDRSRAGVLNAVNARNGLDGTGIEDVIWGNVTQVGEQGGAIAGAGAQIEHAVAGADL